MKYVQTSVRLPRSLHRRMNRACNDIDCFKVDWVIQAAEEFLKLTPDEQIAAMKMGKESTWTIPEKVS